MIPLRPIRALGRDSMRGITPATITSQPPVIEWVDPKSLFVEDDYQRDVHGESSVKQVRKTVRDFDWTRFKLPVCVRLVDADNALVVIDGQHTATACATHPDIDKIPVAVVGATTVAGRARAFVGHNRDRVGLTQMAIFHADVVAGNELAVMIDRAAKAAGAKVLPKAISLAVPCQVGGTIAVGSLRILAREHGEAALTRVLTTLVKAGRGPIRAEEISATAQVLIRVRPQVDARLVEVIASKSAESWRALAAVNSVESGKPTPVAMAGLWCRALDLDIALPTVKATGKDGSMATIKAIKKADPEPPVCQTPAPVAQPKAAPPPPPAAPAASTTRPSIKRNGIEVKFGANHDAVVFRGLTARVTDDQALLVGALAKVMPAMLGINTLAKAVYGKDFSDSGIALRALVEHVTPKLEGIGLTVKVIPKTGYTLAEASSPVRR